jgi:hypothetical protein
MTALKGLVLAHPVTLSLAGGILVGAGAYWGIAKLLNKKESDAAEPEAATT